MRCFVAHFEPDVINTREDILAGRSKPGDTIPENNNGSAFTFVQGQGRVLYVDNSVQGSGDVLAKALREQKINVEVIEPRQVPEDLARLQDYDAIILNNVPHWRTPTSAAGLNDRQDALLASYVHDFGGGLIMIGGPDSFGAGGWQGSKIEQVMPVDFDIPAQRQLPKGALVLVIHSCEMPQGNYWGEQCAIKAVETLSGQDDIGVISYNWNRQGRGGGMGAGGSSWDYPLSPKLDGSGVIRAIKAMTPGDMMSFDDCLTLALHGAGSGQPSLLRSDAAQKHVIIISDGDPAKPQQKLIDEYCNAKPSISISTVSVSTHGGIISTAMKDIADATGGRSYGPIENNLSQLPQIFVKEAAVVRRTLLQQSRQPPIMVAVTDRSSDMIKGIDDPPPIYGMVLCQKKNAAGISVPLMASLKEKADPLLAHWQAGLGKTAAFASDAAAIWDEAWLSGGFAPQYGKLFSQVVRGVQRPPMSQDFMVGTERRGERSAVSVEAVSGKEGFTDFLSIAGTVVDPDGQQQELRLVQTGPGTYTADFPTPKEGNYVVAMQYSSGAGASRRAAGWCRAWR